MRSLVALLVLAMSACGSPARSTPAAAAAPPPSADAGMSTDTAATSPDAGSLPDDCANACTEIAVCHEEVYEKEYGQGGYCTVSCEDKSPDERQAFFRCVAGSRDACARMVEC